MAFCQGELFFWTLKSETTQREDDVGCQRYHDKAESQQGLRYGEERILYTESRDGIWTPSNKPKKTRDSLKELEEILSQAAIVATNLIEPDQVKLAFNNGIIVTIYLSGHNGDVDRLCIDRYLVGRLGTDAVISDALFLQSFLLLTFLDDNKLDYLFLRRGGGGGGEPSPNLGATGRKNSAAEKLGQLDPKLGHLELPGPTGGRRIERKLNVNASQDVVMCWWRGGHLCESWGPNSASIGSGVAVDSNRDRANLVLLGIIGSKLDVLTFLHTQGVLFSSSFSTLREHRVFTVEQNSSSEFAVDACVYELVGDQLVRRSVATIPCRAAVLTVAWAPNEDRLLLGVADGTAVVYDCHHHSTHVTRLSLLPTFAVWHPSSAICLLASAEGQLQFLDAGLGSLRFLLLSENGCPARSLDLSSYFVSPPTLSRLCWASTSTSSSSVATHQHLFLAFSKGPIGTLAFHLGAFVPHDSNRMSHKEIIHQYLKYRQIDQALNLLATMNWDKAGNDAYSCLTGIFDHLIRMPLNPERESWIETLLGCFYAPVKPWAKNTVSLHKEPLSRYARRFFHHLLRYSRFEKAFLLAVDIGSHDLFMDIHYLALDKGNTGLAEVAKNKADELDDRSLDDDDDDDEDVDSTDLSSEEDGEDENEEEDDEDDDEDEMMKLTNGSRKSNEILPGVPSSTPIAELTPEQIRALAKGIDDIFPTSRPTIDDWNGFRPPPPPGRGSSSSSSSSPLIADSRNFPPSRSTSALPSFPSYNAALNNNNKNNNKSTVLSSGIAPPKLRTYQSHFLPNHPRPQLNGTLNGNRPWKSQIPDSFSLRARPVYVPHPQQPAPVLKEHQPQSISQQQQQKQQPFHHPQPASQPQILPNTFVGQRESPNQRLVSGRSSSEDSNTNHAQRQSPATVEGHSQHSQLHTVEVHPPQRQQAVEHSRQPSPVTVGYDQRRSPATIPSKEHQRQHRLQQCNSTDLTQRSVLNDRDKPPKASSNPQRHQEQQQRHSSSSAFLDESQPRESRRDDDARGAPSSTQQRPATASPTSQSRPKTASPYPQHSHLHHRSNDDPSFSQLSDPQKIQQRPHTASPSNPPPTPPKLRQQRERQQQQQQRQQQSSKLTDSIPRHMGGNSASSSNDPGPVAFDVAALRENVEKEFPLVRPKQRL